MDTAKRNEMMQVANTALYDAAAGAGFANLLVKAQIEVRVYFSRERGAVYATIEHEPEVFDDDRLSANDHMMLREALGRSEKWLRKWCDRKGLTYR